MVRKRLNLMLSEVCQLEEGEADFSSDEKLTRKILECIANERVKSVHIKAEEAKAYIEILDEMYSHSESYNPLDEQAAMKAQEDNV